MAGKPYLCISLSAVLTPSRRPVPLRRYRGRPAIALVLLCWSAVVVPPPLSGSDGNRRSALSMRPTLSSSAPGENLSSQPSPLSVRLAHHLSCSLERVAHIPWDPVSEITLTRGQALYKEGDEAHNLYAVEEGWAIGYANLRNGRRFIYHIYQAGDLIGLEDINWSYATSNVEALEPFKASAVPKSAFNQIIRADTYIGTALMGLAMLDQIVAMDRARSNSRNDGPGRLAHMILRAEARAQVTGSLEQGWFNFPLTQQHMADALGLTPIHVNRSMQKLLRAGLIEREKKSYRIIGRETLNDMAEFTNRYDVADHFEDSDDRATA